MSMPSTIEDKAESPAGLASKCGALKESRASGWHRSSRTEVMR